MLPNEEKMIAVVEKLRKEYETMAHECYMKHVDYQNMWRKSGKERTNWYNNYNEGCKNTQLKLEELNGCEFALKCYRDAMKNA